MLEFGSTGQGQEVEANLEQKLTALFPPEKRAEIDANVPKQTLLEFRSGAVNSLRGTTALLQARMSFLERNAKLMGSYTEDYMRAHQAIHVVLNTRSIQSFLAEMKLTLAEYRTALSESGNEPEPADVKRELENIQKVISEAEAMLKDSKVEEAKKEVEQNGLVMQRWAELPSYTEIRQPLPQPKSVADVSLKVYFIHLSIYVDQALAEDSPQRPKSRMGDEFFGSQAYREIVQIKTLEKIKNQARQIVE